MATGGRNDPFRANRFLVEIDQIVQAGFSECSGFNSSVEVVEYREGGDANTVRKLPGKLTYGDISLKWGTTTSRELYDWHMLAVNGTIERRNGSIIVLNEVGEEAARWNFFEGWPSKWEGASLNATGNEVSIETLTISCERIERA